MVRLKAEVCLRGIMDYADEILREEGLHHYNLFIDEKELNELYDKLERMRDNIMDEKRGVNG